MAISLPSPGARPAPLSVLMTADAVGGIWRYAVDLGSALASRGVHVSLAVMGPAPRRPQLLEAAAAGLTICHRPYHLEWMPNPWPSVEAAGEWLLAVARSVRPDVVHLNGYCHATLAWPAPVVVVAHSCIRSWWSAVRHEAAPADYDQYTAAVTAGLNAAAAIVAPTAAMLSSLAVEYGTLGARAHVIPNGCAPLSDCLVPPSDEPKQPIVLTAGRAWDAGKNIAAVEAIAHRLTWPVVLAGATMSPAGESAAFAAVHVLGEISASEMREWYDRAAIYALPARYEPFGLSVLEAARAGCALVLGDIESLRENWHGTALFVRPDDSAALGAAIQSLIDDPIRRCRLAAAARARAGALSIDRTAREYLGLYRSVLA